MKKSKFYAVKSGYKIGIFDNWTDCNKQIHGFSGAIYKSFENLGDAEVYLNGQPSKCSHGYETKVEIMEDLEDKEMIVYVDGSNRGDGSEFSWGIVTFSKKLGKYTFNGKSKNKKFIKYRNIAGELFASVNSVQFAINNGMKKVIVYHDYSGIRHWALGEWKCKNDLSNHYKSYFKNAMKTIDVQFVKVKGHDGDKFNEEADKLAKAALGI